MPPHDPIVSAEADPIRAMIQREIDFALHPKGMSTHSGKVQLQISHVQRMLTIIDRLESKAAFRAEQALVLADRLSRMTKWLEENQPDVFRRGIWEVI
jgi:hypothetical protein